jgi:DNA replication protein DnaC
VSDLLNLLPSKTVDGMRAICDEHGQFLTRIMLRGNGSVFRTLDRCPECARIESDRVETQERLADAQQRQLRLETRMRQCGLPAGFLDRTFSTFSIRLPEQQAALARCQSYALDFGQALKHGSSLVMLGGVGTGKTHLAASIANDVMRSGYTVMYSLMMDLIFRIRDTMRRDSPVTTSELLDAIGSVDLLILDELGVQKRTDDVQAHINNILDRRYRQKAPIILISNLAGQQLAQSVGERVTDRLRECATAIRFNWESQRASMRKTAAY